MNLKNLKLSKQSENDRHKHEKDRLKRDIDGLKRQIEDKKRQMDNEDNRHYQAMRAIEQQEEQAMRHERAKNEDCSEPSIQELNSIINETFTDSDEL